MFKINMEQIQHNIIESALKAPFSTHTHTHFPKSEAYKTKLNNKIYFEKNHLFLYVIFSLCEKIIKHRRWIGWIE